MEQPCANDGNLSFSEGGEIVDDPKELAKYLNIDWNAAPSPVQARMLARDSGKPMHMMQSIGRGTRIPTFDPRFDTINRSPVIQNAFGHLAELQYGLTRVMGLWASLEDRRSVCNARQQQLMVPPFRIPPTEYAMQIVALQLELNDLQTTIKAMNEHIAMFQRFILVEKRRLAE